jgi:hypothetical protein
MVAGALTGLDYDFARSGRPNPEIGFGRVLALLALVALAWRISRGRLPDSLWASLAIAVSYWALGALGAGLFAREPALAKYVYPGMIVALLVATDAARGIRISPRATAVLFAIAAIGVATNVALLRDGGSFLRNVYTEPVRAQLAAVEVARDHVAPTFNPFEEVPDAAPDAITIRAEPYLSSVDRFGSPAFSIPQLEQRGEQVRHDADLALVHALELDLRPGGRLSGAGCETVRPRPARAPIRFELAPGANTLRANSASPVSVEVMRFADELSVPVGTLEPRRAATLSIPGDEATRPWIAVVAGARSVTVCNPGNEGVG